jgi:pSer/pThr/pTyr-binding forkhead associated (FHA) protein
MPVLIMTQQPRAYAGGPYPGAPDRWKGPTVGQLIPLDAEQVLFGRDPVGMDVRNGGRPVIYLPHHSVNRHHAAFRRLGNGYVLQDMQSRNGVRVNGARVAEAALNDGDRVVITVFEFVYRSGPVVTAEEIAAAVASSVLPQYPE